MLGLFKHPRSSSNGFSAPNLIPFDELKSIFHLTIEQFRFEPRLLNCFLRFKGDIYALSSNKSWELRNSYSQNLADITIILNSDNNSITIERSQFGTQTLFYTIINSECLYFSFTIKSLQNQVHSLLDEKYIQQYLSGKLRNTSYDGSTAYKDINCLLPGERITIDQDFKVSQTSIFSFNPNKWNHLKNIQEYGEVFKEIFINSIARSNFQGKDLGSQLSGGLDSSSIVCTLKKVFNIEHIDTYYNALPKSTIYNEKYDDYNYVKAVNRYTGYSLHYTPIPPFSLDKILEISKILESPPILGNSWVLFDNIKVASSKGNKILFSGHDGDSIVGYGYEYLRTLILNHNWNELIRQFDLMKNLDWFKIKVGQSNNESISSIHSQIITYEFTVVIGNLLRNREITKALQIVIAGKKLFNLELSIFFNYFIKILKKKGVFNEQRDLPNNIVKNDLVGTHIKYNNTHYPTKAFSNINIKVLEEFQLLAKHQDIKIECPFFDIDLHELCHFTPLEYKYYSGKGRGIMREGLKGILIEEVRNRTNKSSPKISIQDEVIIDMYNQCKELIFDNNTLWLYADKQSFTANIKKVLNKEKRAVEYNYYVKSQILQLSQFAAWLENQKI